MNLAVKFYKDVPSRPAHIPLFHPALVIENCDTPPGPEWVIMSHREYCEYLKAHPCETKIPHTTSPSAIATPKSINFTWHFMLAGSLGAILAYLIQRLQ